MSLECVVPELVFRFLDGSPLVVNVPEVLTPVSAGQPIPALTMHEAGGVDN